MRTALSRRIGDIQRESRDRIPRQCILGWRGSPLSRRDQQGRKKVVYCDDGDEHWEDDWSRRAGWHSSSPVATWLRRETTPPDQQYQLLPSSYQRKLQALLLAKLSLERGVGNGRSVLFKS